MYPWFVEPHRDMNFKDWLEAVKAFEEWKSSQKPKEEKKEDKNKFGPWDYFALYTAFHSIAVICITVLVLSHTH